MLEADIFCSQPRVQKQSAEWVEKSFPDNGNVAYLTMVSIPSDKKIALWTPLEPANNLSLEEARLLGADYAFLNAGRLDYETYPYFNDFFIVPTELYENSYPFLALAEYRSRAKLLNKIRKPMMCDTVRIYYYQFPSRRLVVIGVTGTDGKTTTTTLIYEILKKAGLVEVIGQKDLSFEKLEKAVAKISVNYNKYVKNGEIFAKKLPKDATRKLANYIIQYV